MIKIIRPSSCSSAKKKSIMIFLYLNIRFKSANSKCANTEFLCKLETKRLPRLIGSKVSRFIASAHFVALCKALLCLASAHDLSRDKRVQWWQERRRRVRYYVRQQRASVGRSRSIHNPDSLRAYEFFRGCISAIARYSDRERRLVGREWKRTAKNFRNFQFFLSAHSTSRFRHRCKSTGGYSIFLLQLFLFFWTFLMVHILMHACLVWAICCCWCGF